MPKRLRWYLEREPQAVRAVLHILLRVVEGHLRRSSDAGPDARFGAVSFIHRFGASLNRHVHYHCCVIDGDFEPIENAGEIPQSVRFLPAAELTPEALPTIAKQLRERELRWFARSGLIEPDDVREILAWEHSGFYLDAAVRVDAHDRAGLERLLRYCARPPFALERLELLDAERVVYRLPKPQRDGTTAPSLTPLELIDHLAALIPPPRRHRHRYHGVLAPNSPLRAAAVVLGRDLTDDPSASAEPPHPRPPRPRTLAPRRAISGCCCWPDCSSPCRWPAPTAGRTCASSPSSPRPSQRSASLPISASPPSHRRSPPPAWDDAPEPAPDWDPLQQPESDFEFDQGIAW